jgi:hypothetical protein
MRAVRAHARRNKFRATAARQPLHVQMRTGPGIQIRPHSSASHTYRTYTRALSPSLPVSRGFPLVSRRSNREIAARRVRVVPPIGDESLDESCSSSNSYAVRAGPPALAQEETWRHLQMHPRAVAIKVPPEMGSPLSSALSKLLLIKAETGAHSLARITPMDSPDGPDAKRGAVSPRGKRAWRFGTRARARPPRRSLLSRPAIRNAPRLFQDFPPL